MQTFLPYPSFRESAKALDDKRLNKQTMECRQILQALLGFTDAWKNHCITRMWAGYEGALIEFWTQCELECNSRGLKPCSKVADFHNIVNTIQPESFVLPDWFYEKGEIFSFYRGYLLKKSDYYRQFNWVEKPQPHYMAPDKFGNWRLYPEKI